VHVTQARCPHRGGPLVDGLLGGTVIVCPLHGYRFDVVTGAALDVFGRAGAPSDRANGAGNECPALRTFAARIDDRGDVVVDVPEECAQDSAP
jgi:nitrite reductase (NADH) small subunit